MEPMDISEESTEYKFQEPHDTNRVAFPGSRSVPSFLPFFSHNSRSVQQPEVSQQGPLYTGSLTCSPQPSASPYKRSRTPLQRCATFGGTEQDRDPASVGQKSFSRVGTPVQGLSQNSLQLMASPEDVSCASTEMSDRSDVSEMEVVQSSPSTSPSWDRVRAAFSNFSLVQGGKGKDQPPRPMRATKAGKDTAEECESDTSSGVSWEPSLSAVQAAVTFRQSRKKSPVSKPSTVLSSSSTRTSVRNLGASADGSGKENTDHITRGKRQLKSAASEKSSCFSCGSCLKLFAVVTLALAVICAVLLHRRVTVHRENFARIDTELLRNEMASKVFGQHIAMDIVPSSIEKYLSALQAAKRDDGSCSEPHSCFLHPLVLSFHGWTGVGKNFVSDIVTSLFPARTVTKFLVPYHFPHDHLDQLYQQNIETWVLSNVTRFSVNFFIFDEMDKASPGVIQGIQNVIAKLSHQNSYTSPSVFLLLSNSFGSDINQQVFQAMAEGWDRENLSREDFLRLFTEDNDRTTWYQKLHSSGTLTVAVPFLPLEKHHVVQCIRRDLVSKQLSTQADIVKRVLKELAFVDLPGGHQFSQTGCKRVSDKVNLVAFD